MDFWLVIFCTRLIPSSRWGPMLSFRWCFRSGGSASSPKPEPTFGCSDSTFWHQIGEPKASRTGLKVFLAAHLKNILMQYHNIAASYTSQSHEHFSCDISKPKCKQKPFPQDYPAVDLPTLPERYFFRFTWSKVAKRMLRWKKDGNFGRVRVRIHLR